jgi:putative nucleotidyltransferase with HDIG domain
LLTSHENLDELEHLVRSTYQLWEPGWVTFNWRNYTFDHVQRVRGLAVTLAHLTDVDPLVMELAALLHDITKAYDGEYLADAQGKRLVDELGFWRCVTRLPHGQNEVTRLYDRLDLSGQVHSLSSGAIAWHLLRKRGYPSEIRNRVADAITEHLGPRTDASAASLCLYDADLIDANIGMPAFVRNIYIHQHFYDLRRTASQPAMAELLNSNPGAYLEPYIRETLIRWIEGKARDFPPQLRTPAARKLAEIRLNRLQAFAREVAFELDDWEHSIRHGSLAVILYLMRRGDDPSIAAEVEVLSNGWVNTTEVSVQTRQFIQDLANESRGLI